MKKNIFAFSPYLPAEKYGGPVKSIFNLIEATSDEFDYFVISPDHDFGETDKFQVEDGWNEVGKAHVRYVDDKRFSYKCILRWIQECNADMVYLCSIYYYKFNFPATRAANKLGIPTLLAPRSDLLPNCIRHKWFKKVVYLSALRFIQMYRGVWYHSTCDDETNSILKWMKTDRDHIIQIPNLASDARKIDRKAKKKDELRMLYVGRIHPRKNLKYAIECLVQTKGKVLLDIYGSIEDEQYWNECVSTAAKMDDDKEFRYCGLRSPVEIQSLYYQYDCLFFPTLNENYGHVIVESIIAGCPALISQHTTPWDDYHNRGGFVCNLSDQGAFVRIIESLIRMDNNEFSKLVEKNQEYSRSKYNNESIQKRYIETFNYLTNACYQK